MTSSPSKDAIKLPSIRSILKGPTGSCTLPSIFPIVARPPIYTQLPIRREVFPVNQTLTGLSFVFASVQSSDDVEDSCKQQSTTSQSLEIRNSQSIRDRSPGKRTPGTKVANKDGQHLLEIGFQDKSLKIHDELENIQKRISSIAEEYDQLMGEKTRLRRCSEDIKAMTEISNETTVKEGMTEDQKYVPRVVTAYVQ
ncbi:uncharacterized protein EAE98_001973 [Botrytis deweyae]|uniref:Uncharacterized protein n=1 Tax=Botrytis deweyae TaxID=2478750 RepID=A0ABQ7IZD1_9HELO|nr:uncharacterized protein EAE98_001973 [Botrytis deweyae]KAF7937659.1 hypothetical protein EAE98_001973 [Botrytis deweyae]